MAKKYIAEIVFDDDDYEFLKPIMMLGKTKLETFDGDKFGRSKSIKLMIDDNVRAFDYEAFYTFEINDEDLAEGNSKILPDNYNTKTGKFYGKILFITRNNDNSKGIRLKTIDTDKTFAEVFVVEPDILDNINRNADIRLSHKPITSTIYLTDEKTVIGPFSFEKAKENNSYIVEPYNSTDYYVDEYSFNDFYTYCTDILLKSNTYTLIYTDVTNNNIRIKNRKDCMPIEKLLDLALRNTDTLDRKSISTISYLDELRKDRLSKFISQKENTEVLIEELKDKLSKDETIINLVLNNNSVNNNTHKNDELQDQINQKEKEIRDLKEENKTLRETQSESIDNANKIKQLEAELKDRDDYKSSKEQKEELEKEIEQLIEKKGAKEQQLAQVKDNILKNFENNLKKYTDVYSTVLTTSFESSFISKILEFASDKQEELKENEISICKFDASNETQTKYDKPKDLLCFLYENFKKNGRKYSKNDIANILICISQGFLSIFAGEPGTGKTSFVKYLAKFLGLNSSYTSRYTEISVEKGWTSKRDLLGYYNPLTKEMNVNNPDFYRGLRLLNKEARNNILDFPYFVLLDEANLSPMEYYWADFMKICDYNNCTINISENKCLNIPKTLRFLATINLDHTTEILSPRLIDRSWIIKLPVEDYTLEDNYDFTNIEDIDFKLVKNNIFEEISNIDTDGTLNLKTSVVNKFNKFQDSFKSVHILFSPRILRMVKKYCLASDKFELMETNGNELTSLDYAISQKILPMINGQGEKYKELVESLISLTDRMPICNKILNEIKENAETNGMEYYSFFAR